MMCCFKHIKFYTFIFLISYTVIGLAQEKNLIVSINPSFGISGSAPSINTLFIIGLRNKTHFNALTIRYAYLERGSGGLLDYHLIFKYWDRNILYVRGFYQNKATILLGIGIGVIQGKYRLEKEQNRAVSIPIETRIYTANSENIGIGMSFCVSINKEYFYFGGGLNLSFGKLK